MLEQSSRCHHGLWWLWVPAFAGTTTECDATACLASALPDSIFKQHARVGLAPFAPTKGVRNRSRAEPREVRFGFAPVKRGAWSAARRTFVSFRFRHRVRGDVRSGSASPCGAPLRRFWARGPYFRVRTGEVTRPLIRTAFAAFARSASSRQTAEPHSWPGR